MRPEFRATAATLGLARAARKSVGYPKPRHRRSASVVPEPFPITGDFESSKLRDLPVLKQLTSLDLGSVWADAVQTLPDFDNHQRILNRYNSTGQTVSFNPHSHLNGILVFVALSLQLIGVSNLLYISTPAAQ